MNVLALIFYLYD
jgi:peroxin-14